nr:transposase [Streptomyces exfoliatus]
MPPSDCWGGCGRCTTRSPWSGPTAAIPAALSTGRRRNSTSPCRSSSAPTTWGGVVLPRRWVVERTFAWLMHSRRLARDYETLPAASEAMIRWSMITRMGRRLARPRVGGRR